MMASQELLQEMEKQVNRELESEYAYMCMKNWLEKEGWSGFAQFIGVQADEEREHAMKFYDFLHDVGYDLKLHEINPLEVQGFERVVDVFRIALQQEMEMTDYIAELYSIAKKNNDQEALPLLHWFQKEQLEEESLMDEAVNKITLASDSSSAMLILDNLFGKRDSNEFEF